MLIIRRAEQTTTDRYPRVPRYAISGADSGQRSLHVGDLTFLPGSSVPYHYHNEGAEETQIMLEGELECWIDGSRITVGAGDTVTAPPGIRHAFYNRSDTAARMITAFPLTPPETTHVDDPELADVAEHSAIIPAESRRMPYMIGSGGVERVELSGDFSGASSTYTYFLDVQAGATVPVQTFDHETVFFVVRGWLVGNVGDETGSVLGSDDAVVASPNVACGFSNGSDTLARLLIVHPVINPV
ncbi:MAG: cupin domain-containing protein [Chloroflexi bacterium]|nr:cupin domain-containing protein [Chloroflexota bacterium]